MNVSSMKFDTLGAGLLIELRKEKGKKRKERKKKIGILHNLVNNLDVSLAGCASFTKHKSMKNTEVLTHSHANLCL